MVLSGFQKSVTLGQGLPTIIIGERINPTGRKKFAETIRAGDLSIIQKEALDQVMAGADVLDVNVGVPGVDEVEFLPKAIKAIQSVVDVPLCVDSSNHEALEAALEVCAGRSLINSANGEEHSWRRVFPIARRNEAAVIVLCMDGKGIPAEAKGRFEIAEMLLENAEVEGIPRENVLIDCLAMSVSVDSQAAPVTLETIERVSALGAITVIGASNISFGLPDRQNINAAFVAMAVRSGLNSVIMDPLAKGLRRMLRAADLLMGHDEWAENCLKDFRKFG